LWACGLFGSEFAEEDGEKIIKGCLPCFVYFFLWRTLSQSIYNPTIVRPAKQNLATTPKENLMMLMTLELFSSIEQKLLFSFLFFFF